MPIRLDTMQTSLENDAFNSWIESADIFDKVYANTDGAGILHISAREGFNASLTRATGGRFNAEQSHLAFVAWLDASGLKKCEFAVDDGSYIEFMASYGWFAAIDYANSLN